MGEISEGIGSVIPMELVDGDGNIVETLICDSIAGGTREIKGMPKDLSLMRIKDGKAVRARYVFSCIVAEKLGRQWFGTDTIKKHVEKATAELEKVRGKYELFR